MLLWTLATLDQVGTVAMPRLAASLFILILRAFHHKVAPKASYLYVLKQIESSGSYIVSATRCLAYTKLSKQMARQEVDP